MVAATILIHLAGLGALLVLMRVHGRRFKTRKAIFDQVAAIIMAAFGLFALHTVEIWAYAGLYQAVGAIPDFESALYFSTVTYSTLGYGDILLDSDWRILGAVEAANGLVLLGWSTAFFVSIISRLRTLEQVWMKDE